MSLGYDDLLEELELLPQWQRRKPQSVQVDESAPKLDGQNALTTKTNIPVSMMINADASMAFLMDASLSTDAKQLLTNMLKAIDFSIHQTVREVEVNQLDTFRDVVMVVMGQKLGQVMLSQSGNLESMRQQVHPYQGNHMIVTHALSDLLVSVENKTQCWQDLCFAQLTIDNLKSQD